MNNTDFVTQNDINKRNMSKEIAVTRTTLFSNFNKLIEEHNVLFESSLETEKQFLRYVRDQEQRRLKLKEYERECREMKIVLQNVSNEAIGLQKKLDTARKMIDEEKKRYYACVDEKYRLLEQLESVRAFLVSNDSVDATSIIIRSKLSSIFDNVLSKYPDFCSGRRKRIDLDATFSNRSLTDNYSSSLSSSADEISHHHYQRYNCNLRRHRSYSSDEFIPIDSCSSKCSTASISNNNRRKTILESIYNRPHKFAPKLSILLEKCLVCDASVLFRQQSVKCDRCHVHCHFDCSRQLPIPCFRLFNHQTAWSLYHYPNVVPLTSYILHDDIHNNNNNNTRYSETGVPLIPGMLIYCIREIENRLPVVGLYQQQTVTIDKKQPVIIKQKFFISSNNKEQTNLYNADTHLLCGLIKQFFNSLSHTLIPYEIALSIDDNITPEKTPLEVKDYRIVTDRLDKPTKHTLAFLMSHLQTIVDDRKCRTSVENLSTIFGPILVGLGTAAAENSQEIKRRMRVASNVITEMLNYPRNFWLDIIEQN